MRPTSILMMVCLLGAPVLAAPLNELEFEPNSIYLTIEVEPFVAATPNPVGPVPMTPDPNLFAITIYSVDDSFGNSDTFIIEGPVLTNSDPLVTTLGGLATATIQPGSVRFSDFIMTTDGHIGSATGQANVYLETTILIIGGGVTTTFSTADWYSSPVTAAMSGSTLTVEYGWVYEIGLSSITATITLDFIVHIEGTVPEPGLGSLIILGLGSAGAWLRRRRI